MKKLTLLLVFVVLVLSLGLTACSGEESIEEVTARDVEIVDEASNIKNTVNGFLDSLIIGDVKNSKNYLSSQLNVVVDTVYSSMEKENITEEDVDETVLIIFGEGTYTIDDIRICSETPEVTVTLLLNGASENVGNYVVQYKEDIDTIIDTSFALNEGAFDVKNEYSDEDIILVLKVDMIQEEGVWVINDIAIIEK
jgi:hypothetical protein